MGEQRRGRRDDGWLGSGGLVGGGPSLVGVSGALRARDASRIRDEDLAEAERRVVVKHAPPRPDTEKSSGDTP